MGAAGLTSFSRKGARGGVASSWTPPGATRAAMTRRDHALRSQERLLIVAEPNRVRRSRRCAPSGSLPPPIGRVTDDGLSGVHAGVTARRSRRTAVGRLPDVPPVGASAAAIARRAAAPTGDRGPIRMRAAFCWTTNHREQALGSTSSTIHAGRNGARPGGDGGVLRVPGPVRMRSRGLNQRAWRATYEGERPPSPRGREHRLTGAEPIGVTDCLNFGIPTDGVSFSSASRRGIGMLPSVRLR